jgi:hypothetical protein
MIGACLWMVVSRLLGVYSMSDEMFEETREAIREQGERLGLS